MTDNNQTNNQSKNSYLSLIIFIIFILGLTLPFHYLPDSLIMFPKEHFTFKNTIIMQKEIDDLIKRHNDAQNIFEQNSFNNDPLIRTLREQGIIYTKSKEELKNEKENEK